MAKTNIPVLYRIFKAYVKFLVEKVYYRRVHYINTGSVPSDGTPLLIVSDHQNSLNDALGVLLSISDRIVHFIVRADVFALGPFVDKFLRKIGLLPAFRLDWEGESALKNNGATFRDSEKALLDGNTVVIYPEAGHQTRHFLGTFSYGYTKMAFEAAEMGNFEKEIFILPSCNHYSAYRYLRTDMLIEYGTPISIKPFYELYKIKPRTAQRHVNALVREQIKSMMLSVDDIDNYEAIDFIRQGRYGQEFAKRAGLDPDQLPQKLQSDRNLVAALTSAKESRPEAVAEVYAEASALWQEMEAEGLTDTELDATPSSITLIVNAIVMVALVPLAVFCHLAFDTGMDNPTTFLEESRRRNVLRNLPHSIERPVHIPGLWTCYVPDYLGQGKFARGSDICCAFPCIVPLRMGVLRLGTGTFARSQCQEAGQVRQDGIRQG